MLYHSMHAGHIRLISRDLSEMRSSRYSGFGSARIAWDNFARAKGVVQSALVVLEEIGALRGEERKAGREVMWRPVGKVVRKGAMGIAGERGLENEGLAVWNGYGIVALWQSDGGVDAEIL